MIPVETARTNFTYELPGRPGEGDLPCLRDLDNRLVTSFWRLEPEDRLASATAVYVKVFDLGRTVGLGVADPEGNFLPTDATALPSPDAWPRLHALSLTADLKSLLAHDALIWLTISGIPSPVIQLWIE